MAIRSGGAPDCHNSPRKKQSVAVVGSGLAGLTSAYLLHNDKKGRFNVEIFEMGNEPSFDAASISVQSNKRGVIESERIDVPMRAFAGGYYPHVLALYKYMGIQYRAQKFLFTFSNDHGSATRHPHRSEKKLHAAQRDILTDPTLYFIHSSNNHRLPPIKPVGVSWLRYAMEVLYLWLVYRYFTLCCTLNPPTRRGPSLSSPISRTESLREYFARIRLPQYFIENYFLPLISSVTTCPHENLLNFPASDITRYKKSTDKQPHYIVEGGVGKVQSKLLEGIQFNSGRKVIEVKHLGKKGVLLIWEEVNSETGDISYGEDVFDQVVLAVSPVAIGGMYKRLSKQMSKIPCCEAEVVVHYDERVIEDSFEDFDQGLSKNKILHKAAIPSSFYPGIRKGVVNSGPITPSTKLERLLNISNEIVNDPTVHMIQLKTSSTPVQPIFTYPFPTWKYQNGNERSMKSENIKRLDTINISGDTATTIPSSSLITESTHIHPPGVLITTSTIFALDPEKIVAKSRFVRVLRTPESRDVILDLLQRGVPKRYKDDGGRVNDEWKNGDEGVWLVGGWCWDGMVLLEGCVRSAINLAKELDVEVPWVESIPKESF